MIFGSGYNIHLSGSSTSGTMEYQPPFMHMTEAQNASIRTIVEENGKKLHLFIRNRVREPEDADDIFQDVMYELTEAYRLMQPIEKIAAWLFRVARNKITDSYRKKKPERLGDQMVVRGNDDDEHLFLEDLLKGTEQSPDSEFDQSLLWEAIEGALNELPPDQREVFLNHEIEGMSFQEMAVASGVSLNTLLSRKRYAVLSLRKRLRDIYDELM